MHQQAYDFVVKAITGIDLRDKKVLEIGSQDVNGSVRRLFDECRVCYGIDVINGKGVDEVIDARYYDGEDTFDIVVSTEAMEHEESPYVIVDCARRALKHGGLFIVTAAGEGRAPHKADGTLGDPIENGEWYRNITQDHMESMLYGWRDIYVDVLGTDIRATAVKP